MATPGQQWRPRWHTSTAYLRSSSRSAGPPKAPGHDLGSDPAAGPGPPGLRPQSWRSPALERRLPSSRRGAAVSPGARHHPSTFALVLSDRPRGEPGECGARRIQKPRLGGPSRMSPQQTARPRQGRTFWSADRAHRRRRGTSRCSNDRPAGARVQVLERLSAPPSNRDNPPYLTPAPGPVALSAGCGTDECQRFFQLFLGARRASTRLFAFEPTGWNKFAALPLYYSPNEWEAAAELALERGQRADVRAEIKTDAGQAAVIVEFGAADRRSLDALHEHAAVTARSGRTVRRRHRGVAA